MTRARVFIVGSMFGASAVLLSAQQRFQTQTELVIVPVSVTQNGRPATGLTAADFALTDNGVAQQIEAVSVDALPIDVTLVLDASSSVRGLMLERLKLAVADTAALLTPTDRLRLIAVQHIIREVFPWQPGGTAPPLDGLTAGGSTSLYDGLAAAMMRTSAPERRHLIVVYTDGLDTSSMVAPASAQQVATATDAVVHAVIVIEDLKALRSVRVPPSAMTGRTAASVAGGLSVADEQQLPAVRPLHDAVVAPTGGRVFPIDEEAPVGEAFTAAIRAFRTSYVLRYSPSGVNKPGRHSITVSVTRAGRYEVRARKGYEG